MKNSQRFKEYCCNEGSIKITLTVPLTPSPPIHFFQRIPYPSIGTVILYCTIHIILCIRHHLPPPLHLFNTVYHPNPSLLVVITLNPACILIVLHSLQLQLLLYNLNNFSDQEKKKQFYTLHAFAHALHTKNI